MKSPILHKALKKYKEIRVSRGMRELGTTMTGLVLKLKIYGKKTSSGNIKAETSSKLESTCFNYQIKRDKGFCFNCEKKNTISIINIKIKV